MLIVKSILPEKIIPLWFMLIYSVSLVSFVYVKEGARGKQGRYKGKTGEIFLIMWLGVYLIMEIINFSGIIPRGLAIPDELPVTCIEVMVIYAYSAKEKIKFLCQKENNK